VGEAPFLNLDSGYIQRAEHILPRQGTKAPWNLHQNYARDLMMLRYGRIDDGTLTFSTPNCVTAPTDLFARAA
jgi:hypothetical protein